MTKKAISTAKEWQFDGLVGPTHNYAGLAYGNMAATSNTGAISDPRQAALQGLEKMRFVRDLGIPQSFFTPHYRPIVSILKRVGFDGGISKIIEDAYRQSPQLLTSVYSSAFMWAANAATVTPSMDAQDAKVHFTPANLISNFHRSVESGFTTKVLRRIFSSSEYFTVHEPLPPALLFSDEGAANHMRVASLHKAQGMHAFVYGTGGIDGLIPKRYPARQQLAAFEAIARSHQIAPDHCLFFQQAPSMIDAGVFHNDVIAMNTTRLMIAHAKAFVEGAALKTALQKSARDFTYIEINDDQLTVEEAVATYFFNSQLLELDDGSFAIVAPVECKQHPRASKLLESLSGSNGPVSKIHYLDVRESMKNGGGPACLRLRVVLTEEEGKAIHQGVVLTDEKFAALTAWVKRHYRDRLSIEDLRDPSFIPELEEAYAALEEIVGMPHLYDL